MPVTEARLRQTDLDRNEIAEILEAIEYSEKFKPLLNKIDFLIEYDELKNNPTEQNKLKSWWNNAQDTKSRDEEIKRLKDDIKKLKEGRISRR